MHIFNAQNSKKLIVHLENFFQTQSQTALKKNKSLIPEHLEKTHNWPILKFLRRCLLLNQNGASRHVFFLNTLLDSADLLCHSSKPNSIPTAEDVTQEVFFRGMYLLPDFICEQTEKKLLQEFDKHEFDTLKNRKVQHFGYNFNYSENSVDKGQTGHANSVPELFHSVFVRDNNYFGKPGIYTDEVRPIFLKTIANSLQPKPLECPSKNNQEPAENQKHLSNEELVLAESKKVESAPKNEETGNKTIFNQFTVNMYTPGNGIPPHVDSHVPFLEPVVSLSLLSPVVITFKNLSQNMVRHFVLRPRCLLLMTGEARFNWSHCIAGRKMDRVESKGVFFRELRISLTCRVIKNVFGCQCKYPLGCDDPKNPNKSPLAS